jgi:hypothetical protein
MKTDLKSPALPNHPSMGRSNRGRCLRTAGLVFALVAAVLTLALTPQVSYAGTATVTGTWPAGQTASDVPNIGSPGAQVTTFTTNAVGPFNYAPYPFTVDTTGIYTATATTAVSQNTTFFLSGLFTPGVPTPTPLSNFKLSVYSGTSSPFTENFNSLSLTAGLQYTALVVYNTGSVSGELSTVTITGPGCIAIGTNTCTAAVPALSGWAVLTLAFVLVAIGLYSVRRPRRICS